MTDEEIQKRALELLWDRLMEVEIPEELIQFDVVQSFMRATCVAAGISYDIEFLKRMLTLLGEEAAK